MALGCWLFVKILYLVVFMLPGDFSNRAIDLGGDLLLVAYYGFFFASILTNSRRSGDSTGNVRRRVEFIGAQIFLLGFLIYFAVIPAAFNAAHYESWVPSFIMYTVFDAFLFLGFIRLIKVAPTPRWRIVYGALALNFGIWVVLELIGAFLSSGLLSEVDVGKPFDLLWFAPYPPILIAARLTQGASTVDNGDNWRTNTERQETRLRAPLSLYACSFPLIHFGLYSLGIGDGLSEPSREILALAVLGILGVLALLQQKLLEAEGEQFRRRLVQTEKMETLGKLAGGIAHDFRNLLTGISGFAECALSGVDRGGQVAQDLSQVLHGAKRAEGFDKTTSNLQP